MSQRHWNRWLSSNSDGFRFTSDWREQVLQSIGLGRSDFQSHDFPVEQQDEEEQQEQHEVLPEMLPEPAESLEVPQVSQAPQVPPSPLPELAMPLPSPMLEVPPTPMPTVLDSPRLKPWSSPSTTPASPMWQPLSEALLPTPILQPKEFRDSGNSGGVVAPAPPTPLSIFEEVTVSDPLKTAKAPPSTSPRALDPPGPEDTVRSSALLRLLSPTCRPGQQPVRESGTAEGDAAEESECVLKRLFRMPNFHEILLEGIGLPKPPDMDMDISKESPKRDRSETLPGSMEPYAKRYRRIWEILQPLGSSMDSSSTLMGASLPPKVSRYELGQTGSILGHSREVRGTGSMTLSKPVVHVKHEKRKRLAHSEITRYLWGREVQPVQRLSRKKKKPMINVTVKQPLSSKKRWSGKAPPTTNELSLCAGQPFILYEYIEEQPTLMMNMGMGHEVLSYFLPRKKSYEGEALGPLKCKTPIQINGPLPHLLGSQMHLQPGQGVSIMDSALLQAPLVRHTARDNHFLLIWNSKNVKSKRTDQKTEKTQKDDATDEPTELHLRPLASICVVGQVEPSRLVQSPNSQESKQMLSSCIRHMLHEVQQRWQKDFSGELEDEENHQENQMHKTMIKDVAESVMQWFPQQGHLVRAEMKEKELKKMDTRYDLPEAVCLLESMRKGEERLQALGIDHLYQADGSLTKALQDLEVLERRRTSNDGLQVLRGRWILEQLQVTPWNLANKYLSYIKKRETKRETLLAVAGPGDPSNGRLEGVSFLPLYVKHTAECLALSKLCLATDSDIVAKLKQHGVSQDMLEPLGRWDRIALLCTKLGKELEKNSDCTVTGWSRATLPQARQTPELKKKHQQLLQDAFQRQLQALAAEKQPDPLTRPDDMDQTDQVDKLNDSTGEAEEAALIEALEDSPGEMKDMNVNNVETLRLSPQSDEDERMEMQRLRSRLGTERPEPRDKDDKAPATEADTAAPSGQSQGGSGPSGPSGSSGPSGPSGKVKMLKVVNMSWGDAGRPPQERVLYVFGEENIRLYRELHSANEIGTGYAPSLKLRSQKQGVASNLSRLSEQSKSTKGSKGKRLSKDEKQGVASNLSRLSEQSKSTKGSKGKRTSKDENDERVSSINSFKEKESDRGSRADRADRDVPEPKASFLKRRKSGLSRRSDAASKLSTQS